MTGAKERVKRMMSTSGYKTTKPQKKVDHLISKALSKSERCHHMKRTWVRKDHKSVPFPTTISLMWGSKVTIVADTLAKHAC